MGKDLSSNLVEKEEVAFSLSESNCSDNVGLKAIVLSLFSRCYTGPLDSWETPEKGLDSSQLNSLYFLSALVSGALAA